MAPYCVTRSVVVVRHAYCFNSYGDIFQSTLCLKPYTFRLFLLNKYIIFFPDKTLFPSVYEYIEHIFGCAKCVSNTAIRVTLTSECFHAHYWVISQFRSTSDPVKEISEKNGQPVTMNSKCELTLYWVISQFRPLCDLQNVINGIKDWCLSPRISVNKHNMT